MSKMHITQLFGVAVAALAAGIVIAIVAVVSGLAGGAVSIGGPQVVTLNGAPFASMVAMLGIAALVAAAGAAAAIASWIAALYNTWQLEDKTWFVALLALGLCSLGWVAMFAYVFAGPDGTRRSGSPALEPGSGS